jgi:sec-independent protein translocase protein TatB
MFSNLGWSEVLVLAVLGLVIFGPERLPKVMADAARMMRQLRQMARSAATDLKSELGPEMADLDLRSLHPRSIFEDALSDDDPEAVDVAATPVGRPTISTPLAPDERPPYDPDAT